MTTAPGAAGGPAVPGGLRERKKVATRTALREAALRLVVRDGLDHVTVDQIADAAGVASRTFRHYFASKEEAVVAASEDGARALIDRFRARPATESVLLALQEAVVAVMDSEHFTSRDHIEVLRLARATPALLPQQLRVLAAQEQALAEAVAERAGVDDGDLYPHVCAAATFATLRLSLARWLDRTAEDHAPSIEALRAELGAAVTELARGLDRPGRPSGG